MTHALFSCADSPKLLPLRLVTALVFLCFFGLAHANDTLSLTGSMATAREGHTATRLEDGRVLVAGGTNAAGMVASAEIYDPATSGWVSAGSLQTARSGHTAVLLQNGNVLVAGGRDALGNSLASAELFNPATGAWSSTGSMKEARQFHTATLLPNTLVLVVGGSTNDQGAGALETSEVYYSVTGVWSDAGLLTNARGLHSATLSNDYLFIFGGMANGTFTSTIEIYDFRRGRWDYVFPGPAPSDRSRKHHTVTRLPNYDILVAGGLRDSPLSTSRLLIGFGLNNTGSLTAGRFGHTASLLPDGRVLAVGGRDGASQPTATTEIYRRTNGSWSPGQPLSTPRTNHTATSLSGGRVLITGGSNDAGALASCEMFTSAPTEFDEAASMNVGRQNHRAVLLPNGDVLVNGGFSYGQSVIGASEVYQPARDYWRSAPGGLPRVSHSFTLLPSGSVLMAGGYADMFGSSFPAVTNLYNPATNKWTTTGSLNHPRSGHAAVLLPDGRVLVAGGGRTGDTAVEKTAEIYDPSTGLWTQAAPMAVGRVWPAATLLTNGKVLVASGKSSLIPTDPGSAEIYDPSSNSWSPAGTLLFPRESQDAILLRDGRVLVVGGFDPSGKGKAEIYDPVSNSWSPTGPMTTEAYTSAVSLLHDGRVLVAGNYNLGNPSSAGKAEIYDPATNAWTFIGKVTTVWHTLTQLKGRQLLVAGGELAGIDPATTRARLFIPDASLGYPAAPTITSAHFDAQDRLVLFGDGFTPDPSVAPVVHLRRLDNGQTSVLSPDPASAWSDESFVSQSLAGQPKGHAMVTVFTGGVAGASVIVEAGAPEIGVVDSGGGVLGDGGALSFGEVGPGAAVDSTITIHNHGRSPLTGLTAVVAGRDTEVFSIVGPAVPSELAPSATTSLTVRFAPSTPGSKSAMLRLISNDADEESFDLSLGGVLPDTPPSISVIADQTVAENGTIEGLAFTVQDAESPASSLGVTASSSNAELLPAGAMTVTGAAADRALTLVPAPHQSGSALVTLTVSDGVNQSTASFTLTVSAVNAPPTLDPIAAPDELREDDIGQMLSLTGVGPGLGDTEAVALTATSSHPDLLPHPVVTYVAPESTAVLTLAPTPGSSGRAEVTVTVDDGQPDSPPTRQTFTVVVVPRLRLSQAVLAEGDTGSSSLQFVVAIGAPQPNPVAFTYQTAPGTATVASDYEPAAGTAIIPPGAIETVVVVPVVGDTRFELDESFTLALSDPVDAYLTESTVTGTILNDDPQPPLQVVAGSVTEAPGGGAFQIWFSATLASPQSLPLTWNIGTRPGTALDGQDFTAIESTALTFNPGETTKWIGIHIPADGSQLGEIDEQFFLDFTTTAGPTLTTTSTGTIRPLKIIDFRVIGNGIYAVRFPTGNGQRYLIEESPSPAGPWTPASAVLLGTGSPVTQVLFSDLPSAFFRAVAAPAPPAGGG